MLQRRKILPHWRNLKLCGLRTDHNTNSPSFLLPPKIKVLPWPSPFPHPVSGFMLSLVIPKLNQPGAHFKFDSICTQIMEEMSLALHLLLVGLAWVSL